MEKVDPIKLQLFQKLKISSLGKEDLSLKGSIDEPIRPLVDCINKSPYFYTTSTCSGRITLIEKPYGNPGTKKGNHFHLSSHDRVEFDKLNQVVKSFAESCTATGDEDDKCLWLKFEPFIMHVQCFNLYRARTLLNLSLAAGCRNSGITLGKPDKFMVAVRSTSSMEIPVHCGSRFDFNEKYLAFLCEEGNRRLSENLSRLNKMTLEVEQAIELSP